MTSKPRKNAAVFFINRENNTKTSFQQHLLSTRKNANNNVSFENVLSVVNWGKHRVGVDKHNISQYFYQLLKSVLFLCLFNFLLYKINELYVNLMNKINKI